jgi:hypothetical protein
MTDAAAGEVLVTFAKGLLEDVAELTATTAEDSQAAKDEAEALKLRIAGLLVECKGNPFIGEPMGPGLHPELGRLPQGSFRRLRTQRQAPLSSDLPQRAHRWRPGKMPLADHRAPCRPAGAPKGQTAIVSEHPFKAERRRDRGR